MVGLSDVEDGHKWLKHVAPQLFSRNGLRHQYVYRHSLTDYNPTNLSTQPTFLQQYQLPWQVGLYDSQAGHKPMDLCDDVFHCKPPVLHLDSRFCWDEMARQRPAILIIHYRSWQAIPNHKGEYYSTLEAKKEGIWRLMLADKEEVHIDLWFSAVARDTQAPWTLQMKSREGKARRWRNVAPSPPFAKRLLEEEQWLRA
jgi:hypothetical protein